MVNTPHFDLDIDSTLGGDNASDYVIPSQKAIKDYVDNNTGSTVDQTYDPTSQAAQSGVAIAGAGFLTGITSSMVTNALGYTPYDSANPAGYTDNVGTVTSVNNVSPVNGNVSLTIPDVQAYTAAEVETLWGSIL